jgi:hypothetical protein
MSAPAQLYALPDDILRAVAAFLPRSGLILLVWCSRRLAAVLGAQLIRRLDGLFVVSVLPEITQSNLGRGCYVMLEPHPTPCDLEALFGKARVLWHAIGPSGYDFVEDPNDSNGPARIIRLALNPSRSTAGELFVFIPDKEVGPRLAQAVAQRRRVLGWLQRRQMQLRAAKAEGD